jgi:hypothetical protein
MFDTCYLQIGNKEKHVLYSRDFEKWPDYAGITATKHRATAQCCLLFRGKELNSEIKDQ